MLATLGLNLIDPTFLHWPRPGTTFTTNYGPMDIAEIGAGDRSDEWFK